MSNIDRKAERLLRQNGELKATNKRLDRDDVGRFLVAALAAELEPEIGVPVPVFPLSAVDLLSNMDGEVDIRNETWKNRCWRYQVPHPGVIFVGVCNAKNEAFQEANLIVESGWASGVGNAFVVARAKVRAGQIMIDWLHYKEGRNQEEYFLGAGFIASDLITDLCLTQAEENSFAFRHIKVRESAQFSYEQIMENLGGAVEISAFEGVMKYKYHLPHPGSVFKVVCELSKVVSGEEKPDHSATGKWLTDLPQAEREIYAFSAGDIINELREMEENSPSSHHHKNGNGNGKYIAKIAKADPVVSVAEVDSDQQAEDERIAAEYDAEIRAKDAAQS